MFNIAHAQTAAQQPSMLASFVHFNTYFFNFLLSFDYDLNRKDKKSIKFY